MKIMIWLIMGLLVASFVNATIRTIDALNNGKEIWTVDCGTDSEYATDVQVNGAFIQYTAMAFNQKRVGRNCQATRLGF